ncbi:MAG: PAS domain S-box protein [Actinomycetota bacterium]|nr:PAS domain S-box protein [Actinomycetota bacterium]
MDKESQEHLRCIVGGIIEAIPDAVIVTDEDGIIIFANSATETILGVERDRIISHDCRNAMFKITTVAGELLAEQEQPFLRVIQSKESLYCIEYGIKRPDGTEAIVLVNAVPLDGVNGILLGVVATFTDISQRKEVEEVLQANEKRLRAITSVLGEGLYVLDNCGRVTFMNTEAERILGWTEEELLGKDMHGVIHYQNAEGVQIPKGECPVIRIACSGGTYRTEDDVFIRKDGATVPVAYICTPLKDDGRIVGSVTAFRDITERRQVEKELRLFMEAVEEAADGVQLVDLSGHIIYSNKAVAEIYGFSPEEFKGKHVNEMNQDPEVAEREIIPSIVETGRWDGEIMVKHKENYVVPVWLTASIVKDDKGAPIAMVGIIRDITKRKRQQELGEALNRINAAISSTLELNEIIKEVVVGAAKALGCETAAVDMCEQDEWVVHYLYGLPQELVGTRFTNNESKHSVLAAKTRKPVVINDARSDERINPDIVKKFNLRSLMVVPLITREEVIGVLFFSYHSKQISFADEEIDFANKLATSISLALENAQLYAQERHIADTLQEALLIMPEHIEGIDFGYLYHSSTEAAKVGGDFYDIFELEHGKIGLIIGDVSGKGLEAAALTSMVRNTLKAHAYENGTPARIMAKANKLLVKVSPPTVFITAFFGVLDISTGKLAYCSAGHPPAIIKRSSSRVVLLSTSSPMVGAFPGLSYKSGDAVLKEGDTLILYTDGVIEARCGTGFYGEERLKQFVKDLRPGRVRDIAHAVLDDVMECSGRTLSDDLALLCVRRIAQ